MKKLNWNDVVKVKLTDWGKEIYYHQFDDLIALNPKARNWLKLSFPKVDVNGFTEFQLWAFMGLYGRYIGMGKTKVVEDISFYIPDDKLEDVED